MKYFLFLLDFSVYISDRSSFHQYNLDTLNEEKIFYDNRLKKMGDDKL